jgi:hypothetical protein
MFEFIGNSTAPSKTIDRRKLSRLTKAHYRRARRRGEPVGWAEARERAKTQIERLG